MKKIYQKGHKKIEGSGIKKGDKHKKTLEWEQFGRDLLIDGLPRAKKILKSSHDEKFMFYFTQLLEYFKPKQSRTEHTGDSGKSIKVVFEHGNDNKD